MKKGLWVLILALLSITGFVVNVSAADPADEAIAKGVKISGFVDLYYGYNFNNPDSRKNDAVTTNFDFNHNTFSLNLAELVIQKAPGPVGFRVDLDFGPTTDFVHSVEPGGNETFKHTQQAYISYIAPIGKGVTLDFGKFVTHMGAEVIESKDNWNYTRGLLFCCAIPYYHAGLRANVPINDMLFVNGYLYNGWNNVVENNGIKTFGAQVGITPIPQLPILLSWIGPEDFPGVSTGRQVYEAIVSYNATDSLSFMVDYNYGTQDSLTGISQKYSGIAAYAKLKLDPYTLALRYENVDDKDNVIFFGTTPDGNKIQEVTLTAERTIAGSLLTRLEYRMDKSDNNIYEDKDGNFIEDSQSRVVLGFVYTF
ncbi:MAG: porin [Nitrospirae bacterium]|nr:porin [Nitrospirota bacterium]